MMNLSGFRSFKTTTFDCLCEISFTAGQATKWNNQLNSRSVFAIRRLELCPASTWNPALFYQPESASNAPQRD